MNRICVFAIFLLISISVFHIAGCRLFKVNSGDSIAQTPELIERKALRVHLSILIPTNDSKQSPLEENNAIIARIKAQTSENTPAVTFKLILLNVGDAAIPTTTLIKTVFPNASGTAEAVFENVPAKTVYAELHIENGNIEGHSNFHGAADLVADIENTVIIVPKESKLREDVIAETIKRITESQTLFAKAVNRLTARIASCIAGLNLQTETIYNDAVTSFEQFSASSPIIEYETPILVDEGSFDSNSCEKIINNPESPINGLKIEVPAGAFDGSVKIKVSVSNITSTRLPTNFTTLTPMISLNSEGKTANEPILITIPAAVSSDKVPVAVRFDPVTGDLESIPITAVNDGSVTVATNDPSGSQGPLGNIRRSVIGTVFDTGIIIGDIAVANLPNSIDSGFRPGTHTWKNPNYGSIACSEGHCAGAVLSEAWCYGKGIVPALYGNYDSFSTSEIWEDDKRAIRLNSIVQKDIDWASVSVRLSRIISGIDDGLTFNMFKASLYVTTKPQYISMRNGTSGHALLVYRVEDNSLYIADPNYPHTERKLSLTNNAFEPFSAALNRNGAAENYTIFHHIGMWSLIDSSKMSRRWTEFQSGTIGNGKFPECILFARSSDLSFIELTDDFSTQGCHVSNSTRGLEICLKENGKFSTLWGLWLYSQDSPNYTLPLSRDAQSLPDRQIFTIPLAPGKNKVGFRIGLIPEGQTPTWNGTDLLYGSGESAAWADFQWITINGILPSPGNLSTEPGNTEVKVSWEAIAGATSYRIYWDTIEAVDKSCQNKTTVATNSHTVTGLTNDTKYYFVVSALGPDDTESDISGAVQATPTNLRYTKDDNGIITDHQTGYKWYELITEEAKSWYELDEAAITANIGGISWRMATMDELKTLYPDAWPTQLFKNINSLSRDIKDHDNPNTDCDETTVWGYTFSGSYVTFDNCDFKGYYSILLKSNAIF